LWIPAPADADKYDRWEKSRDQPLWAAKILVEIYATSAERAENLLSLTERQFLAQFDSPAGGRASFVRWNDEHEKQYLQTYQDYCVRSQYDQLIEGRLPENIKKNIGGRRDDT